VSPICGRSYVNVDTACFIDNSFFSNVAGGVAPPTRGLCWNAITRCLLVCDAAQSCVHSLRMEIDSDTNRVSVLGTNGGGFPLGSRGNAPGKFVLPAAVDVNLRGDIAVADSKLNRIQVFSGSGHLLSYFGKPGAGRGEFRGVSDLKFTLQGYLAIADMENHRVVIMTTAGSLVAVVGRHGWHLGQLTSPCALEVNQNGDMFVMDQGNKRIQRFSMKGRLLAVWGSYRDPHQAMVASTEEIEFESFATPLDPPRVSCFGDPCDLGIGVNGEVVVCDAALQQLIVFSDVGKCLHVVKPAFHSRTPLGVTMCGKYALVLMRSITAPYFRAINSRSDDTQTDAEASSNPVMTQTYALAVLPSPARVAVGKLDRWPVMCLEHVIDYLTYQDAKSIRLVNHFLHRVCRGLRNAWRLFPLIPGRNSERKYNRMVRKATGLAAVHEAFDKWGLRVYKPSNRVRRHVMDFESGFCGALRTFYNAMFIFEHEEILKQLFLYYTGGTSSDKAEIGREAFVEIATLIEEVRAGMLSWHQCPAFCGDRASNLPRPCRGSTTNTECASLSHLPPSLQLVEIAQEYQLGKLLRKLQTM
jgi:hypothetical protein